MSLRFLQLSDIHLGARLGGIPEETAQHLREASREAVRSAFSAAHEQAVDVVLLPGDLFESSGVDPAGQLRFVYEQAAALAPVPVILAPGNHDEYGPESPYASEEPPENVSLFTTGQLSVRDTRIGTVVGRAVQAGEGSGALDWSTLPVPPLAPSLLILHASVLHGEDTRRHSRTIVPTTAEALQETGYAYVALGHYHDFHEWKRPTGLAYAAYAGCPQGLGWDEPGPKGYLIGELTKGGAQLGFVPAARHVWQRRKLSLPPDHVPDAEERLAAAFSSLRAELEPTDLLALEVRGRWPQTDEDGLRAHVEELVRAAWHVRPVDWSRVEFMPNLVSPGESEALDRFLARCDSAIAEAEDDTGAWELARYLGHRLLSGQPLPEEIAG
jgi:DNA repair exonuclease SbcCD nuclease subunit